MDFETKRVDFKGSQGACFLQIWIHQSEPRRPMQYSPIVSLVRKTLTPPAVLKLH